MNVEGRVLRPASLGKAVNLCRVGPAQRRPTIVNAAKRWAGARDARWSHPTKSRNSQPRRVTPTLSNRVPSAGIPAEFFKAVGPDSVGRRYTVFGSNERIRRLLRRGWATIIVAVADKRNWSVNGNVKDKAEAVGISSDFFGPVSDTAAAAIVSADSGFAD